MKSWWNVMVNDLSKIGSRGIVNIAIHPAWLFMKSS